MTMWRSTAGVVLIGLSLSGSLPVSARAADGVVEISHAAALVGGVTPGDAPLYPVTISEPGSYVLTSNLDVSAFPAPEDLTAIAVTAEDVTIDLNGFSILGPTDCSGSFLDPTTCTPADGTGAGVVSFEDRLVVRNGFIRGMGLYGVACQESCRVESLVVGHNGGDGILMASRSGVVRHCVVHRNGGSGIRAAGAIYGNALFENGGAWGIEAGFGSSVYENFVSENDGSGLKCWASTCVDNALVGNGLYGIDVNLGSAWGRNVISGSAPEQVNLGGNTQVDINSCQRTGVTPVLPPSPCP